MEAQPHRTGLDNPRYSGSEAIRCQKGRLLDLYNYELSAIVCTTYCSRSENLPRTIAFTAATITATLGSSSAPLVFHHDSLLNFELLTFACHLRYSCHSCLRMFLHHLLRFLVFSRKLEKSLERLAPGEADGHSVQ